MPSSRDAGVGPRWGIGATLFLALAFAFALGWFMPAKPPEDGYSARSVGPTHERAISADPVRGAP
jgi:hypothetical protein